MIPDNIPNHRLFRKLLSGAVGLPLIVALVALAAFGLGRLSALEEQKGTITIYAPNEAALGRVLAKPAGPLSEKTAAVEKNFVASVNGTKYYAATCASAARIKPENQKWFTTAADAEAAGYTKAANCQ